MDKSELLKILKECSEDRDIESAHVNADEALIRFINDKEVAEAYEVVGKWYS